MPFELRIVTPQGEVYGGRVESVVLPGSEGQFGVLENHERFLTPLEIGEVEIHTAGELIYAAIAGGFAEVRGERVSVLVESCELAAEIDLARAELARDRAAQGLEQLGEEEDRRRGEAYQAALRRAHNRVNVSRRAPS